MIPADAFADPVRLTILKRLAEAGSADVDGLARATGCHRNTVRLHLRELKSAGVVLSSKAESGGPGRPRFRFRLAREWSLPAAGLASVFAAILQGRFPDPTELRREAREWGAQAGSRCGPGERRRSLPAFLEGLGFLAREGGDGVTLRACPCPAVSPGNPGFVCGIMVSAAGGYVQGPAGLPRIPRSTHDPIRRECTIDL